MALRLVLVLVVAMIWGCNNDPDPPPPPPPTTTIPDPSPPPPPPPPDPDDYITITRAGELGDRCVDSKGLLRDLCFDEQILMNDGIRNPDYALAFCCSRLPGPWPITVTATCGSPEVENNRAVHSNPDSPVDLLGFLTRLQRPNKRCDPGHPEHDIRFCGRTDVRQAVFKAWRENDLEPALNTASDLNGIRAWCNEGG